MNDCAVQSGSLVLRKVLAMQPNVDVRQPVQQRARSAAPSHPWIIGMIADEDRLLVEPSPPVEPAVRQYSYASECECPNDCLRDHENE
jgi:hypothetical protein